MGLFSRDFGVEVGEKGTTFHHMYIERNSGDVLGKKSLLSGLCECSLLSAGEGVITCEFTFWHEAKSCFIWP